MIVSYREVGGCPLLGGSSCTKTMLDSIRAIDLVRYIVGIRSWEGPLWEVPLYNIINPLRMRKRVCQNLLRMRIEC